MKKYKKVLYFLTANLVIFSLAFILVEGIFRLVGIPYKVLYIPDENSFARFDPEIGWSYIPNLSAIHNKEYVIKHVYLEDNGIRVPYPDFEFDYNKPSILFIGGSFTMGHGLSYDESFVGKFDALGEGSYQVVNLGVQGYGSDQALLALKKYLPKFNTKIVVYTFIEDHIIRNGNHDRRMLNPKARFLGRKPRFSLTSNNKLYLSDKPHLYDNHIHHLYDHHIRSNLLDFLKIRIGTLLGNFPPFPEELTKSIIQEMKKYCNMQGVHFVVLNWRWTDNDYDALLHDLNIDVIDTMEDAPDNWESMVLHGGIHPDEKAGEHAARLLSDYLNSKNLLQ